MALKELAGFLVSDPIVPPSIDYGAVSLPGVKVGDLIVSVPVVAAPVGHDSFGGNHVNSFLGIVTVDDEVYLSSGIDSNYAPEIVFIILRQC